jgi:hypothetical protein
VSQFFIVAGPFRAGSEHPHSITVDWQNCEQFAQFVTNHGNALGYAAPREEKIEVGLGYMARRRRPEQLNGKLGTLFASCRPDWQGGVIAAQEGERWIVSLSGYLGDHPPADEEGFLEFARSLQRPDIFQVIREAEKLSPLMPYRFGTNLRRHFAELSRFPQGFLVYGDALCSFNPVYGQGMTVAIMESLALRQCLAAGTDDIARRFFRAADRLIDILGRSRSAVICNTRAYRATARRGCASSIGTSPSCSGLRKLMSC